MVKSTRRHLFWMVVILLCLSASLTSGAARAMSRSLSDQHNAPAIDVAAQESEPTPDPAATATPEPGPTPTRIPSSGDITDLSRRRYATLEGPWYEAVNLSLSGAATDPQIVAAPDGRLWAFWWDTFSGLVTTSYAPEEPALEEAWSPPVVAPILVPKLVGEGEDAEWEFNSVAEMPSIVGAGEYAHALWLGQPDEETGLRPLMHSRLLLRSPLQWSTAWAWSRGRVVAETALAWRLIPAADGTLHLVYVRSVHSQASPAGIYHRRSLDGGASWRLPTLLHDDIYYRGLDPEKVHLAVAADREGRIYVTWDDPRLERSLMIASGDGGVSWGASRVVLSDAEQAAGSAGRVQHAQVVPTQEEVLLVGEGGDTASGCTLYQQRLVTATAGMTTTWSAGGPVLEGLDTCPAAPVFLRTAGANPLMLIGTDGETLTAVAWRGPGGLTVSSSAEITASQSVGITSTVQPTGTTAVAGVLPLHKSSAVAPGWSEPRSLSFSFEHPELDHPVTLDHLQATLTDGKLVVVGLDQYGDVWYLRSAVDTWEWAFAPPSPWVGPVVVSQSAVRPGLPALAADAEGQLHLIWSEAPGEGAVGTALHYARLVTPGSGLTQPQSSGVEELSTRWSRPVQILKSPEGRADQPAIATHGDLLYAVWTGGEGDAIYISQAFVRDAYTPGGWSEPSALPMGGLTASSPDALVDAYGALHVVYAAPLNEGRGIYYVRSERSITDELSGADGTAQGQSSFDQIGPWSAPQLVFDAREAGFSAVDHPALAMDPVGTLHVVWVRGSSEGPFPPQAILYAQSSDGGVTWSEPRALAEGAYDWPLVVAPLDGEVHVLWNQVDGASAWIHRWSLDYGQTWTYQQQVRGLADVPGPAGLDVDGAANLHLLGIRLDERGTPVVAYALWRWEEERWEEQEPFPVDGTADPLPGAAVAMLGAEGRLHAVFRARVSGEAESETDPTVLHARRTVPVVAEGPEPAYTPLPTATPMPSPTATPTATPRPRVEVEPPPAGPPTLGLGPLTMPLVAVGGVGLTLIIIIGLILARGVRARR